MSRSARKRHKKPELARQTAILLRWLVWGAIFAMLGVMLFRAVPAEDPVDLLAEKIPEPLPESQRPKLPVDAKLLESIEDNTPFRSAEQDAWFHLLYLVRSTPDETLRRATLGPITWIQLFNQADVYRGEPVTLVGRVKRATRLSTPKNNLGIENYYRLWLQPPGNLDRRIVVYSLELPENFPLGMEMDEPVVVTGLFFKRWLYEGQKDIELAPVVVARSFDWVPRSKSTDTTKPMRLTTIVFSLLVGMLFAVSMVLFAYRRTRRPRRDDLPEVIVIPEHSVDVRSLDEEDEDDEDK